MFLQIYCLPWRQILLIMPVCMALYIAAYRRMGRRRPVFPALCALALLAWALAVLWNTVLSREPGDFGPFQPLFASYRYARIQPEAYRSNFMNILLFFPGGVFLCAAFGRTGWRGVLPSLGLLILYSMAIEGIQYHASLGTAETDDILHNTLGALLGSSGAAITPWLCGQMDKMKRSQSEKSAP